MNKNELLNIIASPTQPIDQTLINQLEELLQAYPYFQGGHILLARAFFQSDNVFADRKIKKAAIYSSDRKLLKTFVYAPTLTAEPETVEPVVEEQASPTPLTNIEEHSKETIEKETTSNVEEITVSQKAEETQLSSAPKEELSEIEKTLAELKAIREASSKEVAQQEEEKELQTEAPKKKSSPKKVTKKTKALEGEEEKPKKEAKPKKVPVKKKAPKKKTTPQPKVEKKDLSTSRLGEVALEGNNEQTQNPSEDNSVDLLLKYLEHTRAKKRVNKQSKKEQLDIIDSFIQNEPTISRGGHEKLSSSVDLSQSSTVENFNIVTENMALLYARQGNIQRSIAIYEELILKYPQKKTYFASQIEKLKN